MQKIKKGDVVIVLAGKDKGRTGKVLLVLPKEGKVKVENINMVKKCIKPNPQLQKPGGILEKEAFIPVSRVAIYNAMTQKADRVKFKFMDDGRKIRCYKSNDEMVDV